MLGEWRTMPLQPSACVASACVCGAYDRRARSSPCTTLALWRTGPSSIQAEIAASLLSSTSVLARCAMIAIGSSLSLGHLAACDLVIGTMNAPRSVSNDAAKQLVRWTWCGRHFCLPRALQFPLFFYPMTRVIYSNIHFHAGDPWMG